MKNFIYLAAFMMILGLESMAQQVKLNRDPQNIVDPTGIMRVLTPPTEVEGSANLFEDWQKAEIYLNQGKTKSLLEINYDIFNHIVAVRVEGKEYNLNPLVVDSIRLLDQSLTLINTNVLPGLSGDALLMRVYNGPHVALYRKTLVEVIKPNYNELLHVGSRNYQIDQDILHYLGEKSTGKYFELKGRKKDFKELSNSDKINTFIKQQHLNLKEESDLIEVVKYYEQLAY
ncbi:MAG: hypothetical protein OER04_02335 [Cyclobacteriaceae bacterium]|nr:hypothetical protein [Cyclobacteriaceae bacterium]